MVSDEDIQTMKDMYRSTKYSKKEVCKKFGVSYYILNKCLSGVKPDMIDRVIRRDFKKAGYTLLSKQYLSNSTPLKYECPKHGEQSVSWNNFQQGSRCIYCNDENRRQTIYREVQRAFKKVGYTLLNKEYINSKAPLRYKCPKHGERLVRWHDFQRGYRCAKCINENRRKSIYEEIKEICKETGYVLLSKEYINNKTPLRYKCPIHGEQSILWHNFKSGSRCPQCFNKGSYNTTLAKRNKHEWIQTPAILYLVKLFNKNESFIKIGITTRSLAERVSKIPYKYKKIALIETNLYNATFIEDGLLEKYIHHKYEPDVTFSGYTECLDIFPLKSLTTQFKEINKSIQEEAA